MREIKKIAAFIMVFCFGTAFFSMTANAYIDPSAMTYIIQVVVGIVIAGGAAFGFYFKRIKRKLKKTEQTPVDKTVHIDDNEEYDSEFDDSDITEDDFDNGDIK